MSAPKPPVPHRDPAYVEAATAEHAAHMAFLTANLAVERQRTRLVQLEIDLATRSRAADSALITASAALPAPPSYRRLRSSMDAMDVLEAEVTVARVRLEAEEAKRLPYPADLWAEWRLATVMRSEAWNAAQARRRECAP